MSLAREAAIALVLVVFVASFRFLSLTGLSDDHYVHLSGAQQILRGEWPSRDFVDLGAPLTYGISAAAQAWFGESQLTEAVLMSAAFALAAVLTLRAGVALTGSLTLGVAAVLIEVLVFPRTHTYPKMVLYSAAVVAILWYVKQPSYVRIVGLAGFAVVAGLVRHDHGLYIGAAFLVALVLSPAQPDRWKGGLSAAVLVASGLVFLMPYFLYLREADGVIAHVMRGFAFMSFEVPRQALAADLPTGGAWLLPVARLTPYVALAVVAVPVWRRRENAWANVQRIGPIVALALLANGGLIRDRLEVCVSLLLVWLVAEAWRPRARPLSIVMRTVSAAVLLVTLWSSAAMGSLYEQLDRVGVFNGVALLPGRFAERAAEMPRPWTGRQAPSAASVAIAPFFDYVDRCLSDGHRLLVPSFLPEVTVLARRPFAGGQVWFLPGALTTPADHERVMVRLAVQRVPVVILRRPTYDELTRQFPELTAFVDWRFTEVARWTLPGGDTIALLMDKLSARGTDAATGWPCFK